MSFGGERSKLLGSYDGGEKGAKCKSVQVAAPNKTEPPQIKNIEESVTNLALRGGSLIVTVRSGAEGGTRTVCTCANTSPLGKVFLTLCLADLNLLLLAAAAELLRLEGILSLELGATMLGDEPVGHGGGLYWRG